jgi:hypothetical protein
MKPFENKLKADAKAYAKKPSLDLHDTIMQNISAQQMESKQEKPKNWFIPAGLVAASMIAVFLLKLNVNQIDTPTSPIINNPKDVNIASLVKNLDTNFSTEINSEYQAITSDIEHLASMIAL